MGRAQDEAIGLGEFVEGGAILLAEGGCGEAALGRGIEAAAQVCLALFLLWKFGCGGCWDGRLAPMIGA